MLCQEVELTRSLSADIRGRVIAAIEDRVSTRKGGALDCVQRGPFGAKDEFLLAATAQNLRKIAILRTATPAAT